MLEHVECRVVGHQQEIVRPPLCNNSIITMLSPRLARVVLMVRGNEGVAMAANFYHRALGLPLHRVTDEWAELTMGHGDDSNSSAVVLHVQATGSEGQLSTGYSPVLTFEVSNMDQTIAACVQAGGTNGREWIAVMLSRMRRMRVRVHLLVSSLDCVGVCHYH